MEDKETITNEDIYELLRSACEDYSGAPLIPMDYSEFPEIKDGKASFVNGELWVNDDPQLERLLSVLD